MNYNTNDIIILCIFTVVLYTYFFNNRLKEQFKYITSTKPIGYIDIRKDNKLYTIHIELYEKDTPMAVKNFKHLLTGNRGFNSDNISLSYKYSSFYKIKPNKVLYGGDFIHNNGTGGQSIYGHNFKDEVKGLKKNHSIGTIGMINDGKKNNNDSRFFINLKNNPEYNNKNVVIGSIVSNFHVLQELSQNPNSKATIVNCGLVYNI